MKVWDMFIRILLWPGTRIVEKLGIDPESDIGLLRSMFNTIIWTTLGLVITLMIVL